MSVSPVIPLTPAQSRLAAEGFGAAQNRARRFARRTANVDPDEIESAAISGLIRAAQNYNESRGAFTTYANVVIDDYMVKAAQRGWRHLNLMDGRSSDRAEYDEDMPSACQPSLQQPDHADAVTASIAVAEVCEQLTDRRHQDAFQRRIRGDRIQDIADDYGVHETTVRRWLWAAGKAAD